MSWTYIWHPVDTTWLDVVILMFKFRRPLVQRDKTENEVVEQMIEKILKKNFIYSDRCTIPDQRLNHNPPITWHKTCKGVLLFGSWKCWPYLLAKRFDPNFIMCVCLIQPAWLELTLGLVQLAWISAPVCHNLAVQTLKTCLGALAYLWSFGSKRLAKRYGQHFHDPKRSTPLQVLCTNRLFVSTNSLSFDFATVNLSTSHWSCDQRATVNLYRYSFNGVSNPWWPEFAA